MLGARRTSREVERVQRRGPGRRPPPRPLPSPPSPPSSIARAHAGRATPRGSSRREPPRRGLERLRAAAPGSSSRATYDQSAFATSRGRRTSSPSAPRVGDSRLQRPRAAARALRARRGPRGCSPARGVPAAPDATPARRLGRSRATPFRTGPTAVARAQHTTRVPRAGGVEGSSRDGGVHRAPRFFAELPPERRERPDEVRDRNRRNRGGTGERAAPNPRLERGQNPAERGRNRARGRREGRSGGRRGVIRGVIRRRATTRRGREGAALRRTIRRAIRRARNIRRSLRIPLPLAPRPRPREFRDGVRDGRGRRPIGRLRHRARLAQSRRNGVAAARSRPNRRGSAERRMSRANATKDAET